MTLPSNTRLGPYEVVSAIGAGGMGEVYLARDTKLRREVALKIRTGAMTDIVRLVPGSSAPPSRLVATAADEYAATLSPDGRRLAYQSNESGRFEV